MILIIFLAFGVWFLIQKALNAIFAKATGDESIGKVIATVVVVVGFIIYCIAEGDL